MTLQNQVEPSLVPMFLKVVSIELMWAFLICGKTWLPLLKMGNRGQTEFFLYIHCISETIRFSQNHTDPGCTICCDGPLWFKNQYHWIVVCHYSLLPLFAYNYFMPQKSINYWLKLYKLIDYDKFMTEANLKITMPLQIGFIISY